MKYLSREEKTHKAYALYTGDLKTIFEAWTKDRDGEWYKFISDDSLKDLVTPVQSHMVGSLISTIYSIIYSKVEIKGDKKAINIEFLRELETLLQLFGEVTVTWDEINGKKYPRIYSITDFDYVEYHNGEIEDYNTYEYYNYNNVEYTFVKNYKLLTNGKYLQTNKLTKKKVHELRLIGDSDYIEIPLDTIPHTAKVAPSKTWDNKPYFIFKTDNRVAKAIDLITLVDEALTFLKLATRQSATTTYVSNDLAISQQTGESVDKQYNPSEMIKNRMYGLMKVDYLDENQQKIDVDQPIIQVDNFMGVKDAAIQEILGIVGISEYTWARGKIGERTSGSSMLERQQQTINTRNELVAERKAQFEHMFEELGFDVVLDFGSFSTSVNGDAIVKLNAVVNDGNLSLRTFIEEAWPLWSEDRVEEEIRRIEESRKTEWMKGMRDAEIAKLRGEKTSQDSTK